MDTPQFRPEQLAAFDPARYDACLGLATDGGLLGHRLRRPGRGGRRRSAACRCRPGDTGSIQLARLREAGLRVQLLDELSDFDTFDAACAIARPGAGRCVRAAPCAELRGNLRGSPVNDGALQPYEQSLRAAGRLAMVDDGGRQVSLDVARWLAPADPADDTVLARCTGPVLDVGCGPGRLVRALSERGIACLGLDIAETAVGITRGRGVPALLRNVFAPVPGEGRWPTVLLMDGNVGIGGDPCRLLARIAGLLAADGRLIVETDPDPDARPGLHGALPGRGQSRSGRPSGGPRSAWRRCAAMPSGPASIRPTPGRPADAPSPPWPPA